MNTSRPLFAEDSAAAKYFKIIEEIVANYSYHERESYAYNSYGRDVKQNPRFELSIFMEMETERRKAQDASPSLEELTELLKKQQNIYEDKLCELRILEKELEKQAKILGHLLSLFKLDMPEKIILSMDTTFGKYTWRQVFEEDEGFLSALETYTKIPTEDMGLRLQRYIARRSKEVNIGASSTLALSVGTENPSTLSAIHAEIAKTKKEKEALIDVFMFLGAKMEEIRKIASKDDCDCF